MLKLFILYESSVKYIFCKLTNNSINSGALSKLLSRKSKLFKLTSLLIDFGILIKLLLFKYNSRKLVS
jgi:hypothetical protein